MPNNTKYIKTGEYITFIKQSIAMNPCADNYYIYGKMLRNNEEALKQFMETELRCSGKTYLKQAVYEGIGKCYEDMGDYDEALAYYKKGAANNPKHPNLNRKIV